MIRIPDPEIAAFIKTVSVVPEIVFKQCNLSFDMAEAVLKLIEKASINDVFEELKSRNLDQDEMEAVMKWWISYSSKQNNSKLGQEKFLQFAVLRVGTNVLPLKNVHYYLNVKTIPPESDVPFKLKELQKYFGYY